MYCRKCGNKLEEGSAFCNYCGTQVITDKPSEEKEAVAEQEPVQEVAKEIPSNTAKRSMKLPLIIGLGAAAVALVAGVVIFKPFGLFKTGTNDDGTIAESDIGETASETAISVGVDVLDYDGHSFGCFFGCSTWEEARDQCEGMGGHLAVITSQEEDEVLFAFTRYCGYDNVYIGYSDIEEEGNWQWVTGETSDYSNWNEGEPNGFTPNENYAVYGDNGAWYDGEFTPRIENGLISFICEWDYHVDGASNISNEELQTYIDGLDAVVTETEAAIETQVPSEEIRAAAYASYLGILEANESQIRDYDWMTMDYGPLTPSDNITCALADVTHDGLEDLVIMRCVIDGCRNTVLDVYSYDPDSASTNNVLTIEGLNGQYGGHQLMLIALSSDGNLIAYEESHNEFEEYNYYTYSYDGIELVLQSFISEEYGPDNQNHPLDAYDYPFVSYYYVNDTSVTSNEFNSTELAMLDSMSCLLQHSGIEREITNSSCLSLGNIAMNYDDMHALLASYLPTPTATPEPTARVSNGNGLGWVSGGSSYIVLQEDDLTSFCNSFARATYYSYDSYHFVYIENLDQDYLNALGTAMGQYPETIDNMETCGFNFFGVNIHAYDFIDYIEIDEITPESLDKITQMLVDAGCTSIVFNLGDFDVYGPYRDDVLVVEYPDVEIVPIVAS